MNQFSFTCKVTLLLAFTFLSLTSYSQIQSFVYGELFFPPKDTTKNTRKSTIKSMNKSLELREKSHTKEECDIIYALIDSLSRNGGFPTDTTNYEFKERVDMVNVSSTTASNFIMGTFGASAKLETGYSYYFSTFCTERKLTYKYKNKNIVIVWGYGAYFLFKSSNGKGDLQVSLPVLAANTQVSNKMTTILYQPVGLKSFDKIAGVLTNLGNFDVETHSKFEVFKDRIKGAINIPFDRKFSYVALRAYMSDKESSPVSLFIEK